MYISDNIHQLKDNPTTKKPIEKGPKTIKINKKKTEAAFQELNEEISHLKLNKSKKTKTSQKKSNMKNSKKI